MATNMKIRNRTIKQMFAEFETLEPGDIIAIGANSVLDRGFLVIENDITEQKVYVHYIHQNVSGQPQDIWVYYSDFTPSAHHMCTETRKKNASKRLVKRALGL